MKVFLRDLLRFLYGGIKRRFFPRLRLNRILPFWDSVYRCLTQHAKSTFVDDVLGHKMFLDEKDSLELSIFKVYEPAETRLVLDQITEGGVVVDIGANIGYYTLQFARKVGARGRVYAFEPDPQNFALLRKNIEVNGYKNVTPVQVAASDVSGTARLYLSEDNKGDHRTYQSEEPRQSVEVQSIRLDDYFKDGDLELDLVKMDIQGAEFRALVGMHEVLRRSPRVVLVTEFWPYGLIRSGADPKAYLDLLLSQGLALFEISEHGEGLQKVSPSHLLEKLKDKMGDNTNLLCRRT